MKDFIPPVVVTISFVGRKMRFKPGVQLRKSLDNWAFVADHSGLNGSLAYQAR